ncbi:hypothetical protein LDENG_00020080 [Lucifuga dentata]|nr:hypothetical protein LDENG_00020080 [Lucifuga dentata]
MSLLRKMLLILQMRAHHLRHLHTQYATCTVILNKIYVNGVKCLLMCLTGPGIVAPLLL